MNFESSASNCSAVVVDGPVVGVAATAGAVVGAGVDAFASTVGATPALPGVAALLVGFFSGVAAGAPTSGVFAVAADLGSGCFTSSVPLLLTTSTRLTGSTNFLWT